MKKRRNKRLKGQIKGSPKIVILSFVSALFLGGSIFLAIYGSTMGGNLTRLEKSEKEIAEANQELTQKLVESTSLLKAQEDAGKLGFAGEADKLYIDTDSLVARLP
ncbi:MAG: hypothetical protein PVJ52_02105 [Candidatus Woesebacteria bacterium]|jgi:hypothetical protein